jgi:recombination DNA repair RAD52 pathway protein
VDEKALQSDLTYAWKEALRYYGMSLGVYAIGVEALVNSSKIQWAIGSEYFNMAANAPTQEEKNKYLGFFESDAAVSVALVHRAVMLDSNSAMALEQMSVVHRGLGLYYSGMAVAVDTALPQDVREKRALMHWRYFKWVSQYYPADPGILKTADEWIWRLQTKWPNEPDPITGEVQQ